MPTTNKADLADKLLTLLEIKHYKKSKFPVPATLYIVECEGKKYAFYGSPSLNKILDPPQAPGNIPLLPSPSKTFKLYREFDKRLSRISWRVQLLPSAKPQQQSPAKQQQPSQLIEAIIGFVKKATSKEAVAAYLERNGMPKQEAAETANGLWLQYHQPDAK